MGGAVSAGENNDDLVDNLLEAEYIKTPLVERVFRAVDRGDYYLPEHRSSAYKDLAWKHDHLHLSAPCIYSEVVESLRLTSNLSFLNLGSGTGYLNTMVGLVLGCNGVNHGVELHDDVVAYAQEHLREFRQSCQAFDEFDFCEPVFVVGNCLQLPSGCRLYDRVYCGAACPPEHENYMKNLIKVNGILVMPLNEQLMQITRVGETEWEAKSVLPVSFATLVQPLGRDVHTTLELPETCILSLQEVCRSNVRGILRENILLLHPDINRRKPASKKKRRRGRGRRLNVVPMNVGMMLLGRFEERERLIDLGAGSHVHDTDSEEETESHEGDADMEGPKKETDHEDESDDDRSKDGVSDFEPELGELENVWIASPRKTVNDFDKAKEAVQSGKTDAAEVDVPSSTGNCQSDEDEELSDIPLDLSFKPKTHSSLSASSTDSSGIESMVGSPPDAPKSLNGAPRIRTTSDYFSDPEGEDVPDEIPEKLENGTKHKLGCLREEQEMEYVSGDDRDGASKPSFRSLMCEAIESLPIPTSVKAFLMYYRWAEPSIPATTSKIDLS